MKRLNYFDVLRVLSFFAVVWYHMVVQLQIDEICNYEQVARFFENSNMNIAMLAVSLFFMLSGASLVYTSRENFKVKQFYVRRVKKVLLPLLMMYVLCLIAFSLMKRGLPMVFHMGIAPWKMLYTILGLDTLLNLYGVSTFTLGLGEWFIGCLIIYYALFPLLRAFLMKCRWGFAAVVAVVYVIMQVWKPWSVGIHQNIVVKGCEFCIGMLIGLMCEKVPKWCLWVCIPVLLLIGFCPFELPIWLGVRITVSAVAFFLMFGALEDVFENAFAKRFMQGIQRIGDYSYEGFLVHHEIIFFCTGIFFGRDLPLGQIVMLLGAECVLIAIGMVVLKWIFRKVLWRK